MKLQLLKIPLLLSISGLALISNYAFSENSEQYISYDSNSHQHGHHRLWREPQNTTLAANRPDLYAWKLFIALNWPGNPETCRADPQKQLGDEGKVTWQTWPRKQEMFLPYAKKPQSWRQGCFDNSPSGSPDSEYPSREYALPEGNYTTFDDDEVRMNKTIYNFMRSNKLYSLDEQERLAKAGKTKLDFPRNSKQVKAHWVRITDTDKPRYHWIEQDRNGNTEIWGLVAFHITTRDMPRWFWATFEHVDNTDYWSTIYPEAFQPWIVPSVDRFSCPESNLACNTFPKGLGIEGTKWEYFRLRGTQTDWVDDRGNPTILTNGKIEGGLDQYTMSCITCHSLAVKGVSGPSEPIDMMPGTISAEGYLEGYTGAINPEFFQNENGEPVPYLGYSFVWSLRNAQREAKQNNH